MSPVGTQVLEGRGTHRRGPSIWLLFSNPPTAGGLPAQPCLSRGRWHMHLVSLPVRGGTGLRPVTSHWDETEEAGPQQSMGEGRGRECRGPGWQAGPSCPMTRMPPGWRPLLLPGRGSGWAKPPQVLEGCQALAPAAPPGPTPPGSYCYQIDCPLRP